MKIIETVISELWDRNSSDAMAQSVNFKTGGMPGLNIWRL
jgi:hypothetical protein